MRQTTTIDGTNVTLPVEIGDRLDDRYEIIRLLGQGLTSVVYVARVLALDQLVALKFLVRESVQRGPALERFRRESLMAARFGSDYACRVLDVRTLENGVPYLVMELLVGCTLASELSSRSRLPPQEALRYVLEACEPISEAHAEGIVHRDLKPQNLFLVSRPDRSRHVKVMDFGVPNVLIESDAKLRSLPFSPRALDSLAYKAPEQLDLTCEVDHRADVWSLAVVLYELLTGRRPFSGDSISQLVHAVENDQPPAFFAAQVIAPDGLEVVVNQALSKSREHRFESIAEFARALAPFAASETLERVRISQATPAPTQIGSGSSAGTSLLGAVTIDLESAPKPALPTEARDRRRSGLVWAIAPLVAFGLGWLLWPKRHDEPAPTAPVRETPQPQQVHREALVPSPNPPPALVATPAPDEKPVELPTSQPSAAASPAATATAKPATPNPAPAVVWRPQARAVAPVPVTSQGSPAPGAPLEKSGAELPDFGGRR